MWALLSARLRTWLLMAIALPLARLLVHTRRAGRWLPGEPPASRV